MIAKREKAEAKMASQSAKKELLEETLHHHPEGSEEEVDKEWEEFTRLMAKLKESRRNRPHRYIHAEFFNFHGRRKKQKTERDAKLVVRKNKQKKRKYNIIIRAKVS